MAPKILIVTGFGVNCEAESRHAWISAGADVVMIHFNDFLNNPLPLKKCSGIMFIGGFSYGDHMGSGHVMALRIRHRIKDSLLDFIEQGGLVLGVCNGFQVMIKLGLLPGLDGDYFSQKLALMQNECGHFQNFWVRLKFESNSPCVFTKGLNAMHLPIRHGEGRLFTPDDKVLNTIESLHCVAARYAHPDTGTATMDFPHNPNGSLNAIAGLCDPTGRIFGLMPHPEAYLFPENHPNRDEQKLDGTLPEHGLGLQIFTNAVNYLKNA